MMNGLLKVINMLDPELETRSIMVCASPRAWVLQFSLFGLLIHLLYLLLVSYRLLSHQVDR